MDKTYGAIIDLERGKHDATKVTPISCMDRFAAVCSVIVSLPMLTGF